MGKLFKYPPQLIMQKLMPAGPRVLNILTLNGRKDLVFLLLAPIGGWKGSCGENDAEVGTRLESEREKIV